MNSLDKQYTDLLQTILDYGVDKKDRTGTGTKSIFGYTIRHNMKEGFPLLTTKKIPFKLVVTELIWFLRGDTNIKFLVDNGCHIWDGDAFKNYIKNNPNSDEQMVNDTNEMVNIKDWFINKIKTDDEFAKKWGDLGPVYGKQWREWTNLKQVDEWEWKYDLNGPIDQIANLINDLKTNPDSRRIMVNAWNVGEIDQMVLPPCHYGFQVYTRELSELERHDIKEQYGFDCRKLAKPSIKQLDDANIPTRAISLMWNQRSVDTFLGLPFNIASYGLLLEIIAKTVNMVPEELIGNLGDVHLYSNHIEQAKEQIGRELSDDERFYFDEVNIPNRTREPYPLPKLNINTEFWPYEGGECGVGPLDAIGVIKAFSDENFCRCLLEEDIQLVNYKSHPAIKAQLSN